MKPERQQTAFSKDHENDTAGELLAYLRQVAEPFGVTPCAEEIIGGPYIARDMEWGSQHGGDSDEQLLNYVSRCAAELEHTPFQSEVLGGAYIAQRFGGWAAALQMAGLRPRNGRWWSPAVEQAAGAE